MSDTDLAVTELVREAQDIPRRNGELVFDEPWHTRAFGMAVALASKDLVEWERFRSSLIERIGDWERSPSREWSYYERWLDALQNVLVERGILDERELELRAKAIAEAVEHEHEH